MKNSIIMIFNDQRRGRCVDIEVPLNITANELIYGLNKGFKLGINTEDVSQCYLCTEDPIALLRGDSLLESYGLRNGTIIQFQG